MLNLLKGLTILLCLIFIYNYSDVDPNKVVRVSDPKFTLIGPYNSSYQHSDDIYHQLINLDKFSFEINPQPCKGYEAGLLLITIVSSSTKNFAKRMVIRNTWGRSTDSTKVVFLLGNDQNTTITKLIKEESALHGDIVQGNFRDVYRNLTYKHIMGLKWVSHHCPMARYVLKTDDDILVNSEELRQFLVRDLSPWGARGLIACDVRKHSKVQRLPDSKWKVTNEEYSNQYYPDYCAGWSILYSQDVVNQVLTVSRSIPYFWIDDVHITGIIAEKIKVKCTPLDDLILTSRRADLLISWGPFYSGRFLFGPTGLTSDRIFKIWEAIL